MFSWKKRYFCINFNTEYSLGTKLIRRKLKLIKSPRWQEFKTAVSEKSLVQIW